MHSQDGSKDGEPLPRRSRRRWLLAGAGWILASVAMVSCGPPPSMVAHAGAVRRNGMEVVGEEHTLAIALHQIGGGNLVFYEPLLEDGVVVVTAGVVSGGAEHDRVYCFDVSRLAVGSDWLEHVGWREPGGEVVPVEVIRGATAREVIARCPSPAPAS